MQLCYSNLIASSSAFLTVEVGACSLYFTGSKEETFFDSRAWLDSDCEDDFYSVNGGKT